MTRTISLRRIKNVNELQAKSEERSKSQRVYPENLKQYHRTCTKSNSLSDFSDIASNLSTSSSGSNILSPSKVRPDFIIFLKLPKKS